MSIKDIVLIVDMIVIIFLYLRTRDYRNNIKKALEEARKDSVKRSKTAIRASVSEELAPLFEGFPYQTSDLKLFGKPIDYIVFDGMSEFRDGDKEKDITIILADLKTGNAVKTPVQKRIMKAIEEGRIRFEEWRIKDNKFEIK